MKHEKAKLQTHPPVQDFLIYWIFCVWERCSASTAGWHEAGETLGVFAPIQKLQHLQRPKPTIHKTVCGLDGKGGISCCAY